MTTETNVYPLRVHSSGGTNDIHDYEMSDGSIKTLHVSDANAMMRARRASKEWLSEERLLNTRAWAASRPDMSGSEVIVGAIDELRSLRAAFKLQTEILDRCEQRTAPETFDEPAAWMTEDGRTMSPELKQALKTAQAASFKIPLYARRTDLKAPCEHCGGSGRLTIYDEAGFGQIACPVCQPEKAGEKQ